jgi:hypothetical protein
MSKKNLTLGEKLILGMSHAGPRPWTFAQLRGMLREMFAIRPTRSQIRLAVFAEGPVLKRAGSSAFELDFNAHTDRLVRQLFGE